MKPKKIADMHRGNVWRIKAVIDVFPRVRTFEDAKEAMVLVVRPEDVAKATRRDPAHCAFACAAKGTDFDGAYIARSVAYFIKGSRAIRYQPSQKAFAEIRAFDIAGTFEPSAYSFRRMAKDKLFGTRHGPKLGRRKHRGSIEEQRVEKTNNRMRKDRPADYVRVFGT